MSYVPLGRVVGTASVGRLVDDNPRFKVFVMQCLWRHGSGDWGDLDEFDKAENDRSMKVGLRVFSAYDVPAELADVADGPKLWVITEHDRAATTLLWPSEY